MPEIFKVATDTANTATEDSSHNILVLAFFSGRQRDTLVIL